MNLLCLLTPCLVAWLTLPGAAEEGPPIPPAFGPHVNLKPSDFDGVPSYSTDDKLVATYLFYWYDSDTKAHITARDGHDELTTHPVSLDDFSYKSVAWHKRQLRDMLAAGIDIVLPVFWGAPTEQAADAEQHWSYAGLPPLVQAREELLAEGLPAPRIGLFYDTSTLQFNSRNLHIDLTTDYGRQWFYATIRDFFSMIPPQHWAMLDDHPLVLLYSASFARRHDQSCIDYLKSEFPKEFGGKVPWLVRQISWQVKADDTCAWGGALGLVNPGVASLGPGYDHSAVRGREPLVKDREGGKFYARQWEKFLRRPSNLVVLETWNEFHEGTDICESREYGRQYIELTRKYTDHFKQGWVPPWPRGKYTGSREVEVLLGKTNRENGLRQMVTEDGASEFGAQGGKDGRRGAKLPGLGSYLYFSVDDSFKRDTEMSLVAEVEYFDAAPGRLGLEYDGSDTKAHLRGAYTRSPVSAELSGSGQWQTATFPLTKACLLGNQNGASDFRLVLDPAEILIRQIRLRHVAEP